LTQATLGTRHGTKTNKSKKTHHKCATQTPPYKTGGEFLFLFKNPDV